MISLSGSDRRSRLSRRLGWILFTLVLGFTSSGPQRGDSRSLPTLVERWKWPATHASQGGSLTVSDGAVYARIEGQIVALDADSGSVRWNTPVDDTWSGRPQRPLVLDDVVVVSTPTAPITVDRSSGQVLATLPGRRGWSARYFGPPLVIDTAGYGARDLVAVDPRTGTVGARYPMGELSSVNGLQDGVVLVSKLASVGAGEPGKVWGLDPVTLEQRWHHTVPWPREFVSVGPETLLVEWNDADELQAKPLDVRSGRLGEPVPFPQSMRDDDRQASFRLDWDLSVDTTEKSPTVTLERFAVGNGSRLWAQSIPGVPVAAARSASTLYVLCESGGRRDFLVAIEARNGMVQWTVLAPEGLAALEYAGGRLFGLTSEGVVSFDSEALGPPAGSTSDLASAVSDLVHGFEGQLTRKCYAGHYASDARDLEMLGEAARPLLASKLPELRDRALAAASIVLSEVEYQPAASLVAAALERSLDAPDMGDSEAAGLQHCLLLALARLEAPEGVAVATRVLRQPSARAFVRQQAARTLASIGTSEAVHAVDAELARISPDRVSWWAPPSPDDPVPAVDSDWEAETPAGAGEEGRGPRLQRAPALRLGAADGSAWELFAHRRFRGVGDLWAAHVDREGKRGKALYTGVTADLFAAGPDSRSRVEADALPGGATLHHARPDGASREVDWSELARDSDADSLPDVVELAIQTSPSAADSDGDGVADASDPAPNAIGWRSTEESDAIALAVFQDAFAFDGPTVATAGVALVVEHERALEWRGWASGPVVTAMRGDEDRQGRYASGDVGSVSIGPAASSLVATGKPLRRNERVHSFSAGGLGQCPHGSRVVVRKAHGRWHVTRVLDEWIS